MFGWKNGISFAHHRGFCPHFVTLTSSQDCFVCLMDTCIHLRSRKITPYLPLPHAGNSPFIVLSTGQTTPGANGLKAPSPGPLTSDPQPPAKTVTRHPALPARLQPMHSHTQTSTGMPAKRQRRNTGAAQPLEVIKISATPVVSKGVSFPQGPQLKRSRFCQMLSKCKALCLPQ